MPLTAAHHATLAAFAEADALIAVDYLQECEATLPEVLLAYAGTAPEFADGLPHEALWEWLHRTEPWCIGQKYHDGRPTWRWEAVQDTRPDWQVAADILNGDSIRRYHVDPEAVRIFVERGCKLYPEVAAAVAACVRDRKRRVLTLFPEVQVPCPTCMVGRWPQRPFDPCPRCGCQDVDAYGTIAASDLIPPEQQPQGPIQPSRPGLLEAGGWL